jgi:hypothetical protein
MTKAAELAKMGEVLTNSQIGGRRNLVINGAMQVAQRGTSFTSTADLYTLDRFAIGHGTVNAMTVTQETDAPSGFQYSLKVLTGTGASSGAAGYGVLRQAIEGTNMYQLKFGTSDAESVTLSFYVKSSLTGTFAVSIRNQAGNRAFAATYTISSANTWEYKTITIAGDTSGTWTADTGIGLHVQFDLGAGSNYDIATGAWTSGSNMFGGESTVKLTETTNATWFLTGLQVEVGEQATPFEHRSFGEELQLCKRYFQKVGTDNGSLGAMMTMFATRNSTNQALLCYPCPVPLRTIPSITKNGSYTLFGSGENIAVGDVLANGTNQTLFQQVTFSTTATGISSGNSSVLYGSGSDCHFTFDSEL